MANKLRIRHADDIVVVVVLGIFTATLIIGVWLNLQGEP